MGIFARFLKKKDCGGNQMIRSVEDADRIVRAFADFIQTSRYPAAGCVADVKRLPFPKDVLRLAFIVCIKATTDQMIKTC